jgi:hypothetical protein
MIIRLNNFNLVHSNVVIIGTRYCISGFTSAMQRPGKSISASLANRNTMAYFKLFFKLPDNLHYTIKM